MKTHKENQSKLCFGLVVGLAALNLLFLVAIGSLKDDVRSLKAEVRNQQKEITAEVNGLLDARINVFNEVFGATNAHLLDELGKLNVQVRRLKKLAHKKHDIYEVTKYVYKVSPFENSSYTPYDKPTSH